ncbi:MAG: DNA polymerase/3'-5' exonuclease PolX [Chitinophagaceae bacterium]|nr:MAG: DNA polymerase/3'-5' exonuclease PolX [Chitinophagaceae bacterium]
MAYDNYYIADQFTLLSKLMDINGENSFKSKSYSIAAFNIEKLEIQLYLAERADIAALKGIGDSSAKKIVEILDSGKLGILEELLAKTPAGVAEMLNIKGLGPKKIATVWKEMGIETIGELIYACNENRLTLYKGFGEKTQKNVQEAIEFYTRSQGNYLFAQVEEHTNKITDSLVKAFPAQQTSIAGSFRRQLEIITSLQWVTTIDAKSLTTFFESIGYKIASESSSLLSFSGPENILLEFILADNSSFSTVLFDNSCSEEFFEAFKEQMAGKQYQVAETEEELFERAGLQFVPVPLREKKETITKALNNEIPELIRTSDIKGLVHSHSTWSDGSDSIETMAKAAISMGLEYLVISDHSKSAFYANGLQEDRLIKQHEEIDALNRKLAPFKIFKSIESDILNDGSLDYPDEVLARFDLVIASVHSNLKMTIEKAMSRVLTAIANPYTTILGHPSGRLLLSRPGYPLDYPAVIEACAKHKVAIELNAHPRRLDLDWRWIDMAIANNVLISIDPDSHAADAFGDIKYGVLAAQKAGVSAKHNLSSYSLKEFEEFIKK